MIVEIINVSSGRSLSSEGAFKNQVITQKYAAGFHLGLLAKDVKIASDLAGELGISAPVCAVTFNTLAVAREALGYSATSRRRISYLESGSHGQEWCLTRERMMPDGEPSPIAPAKLRQCCIALVPFPEG